MWLNIFSIRYVNEFVNFMTVANASVNGFFLLCFCRRYIAEGTRGIEICSWCFPDNKRIMVKQEEIQMDGVRPAKPATEVEHVDNQQMSRRSDEQESLKNITSEIQEGSN